jgi:UDP-3-O-[3-hydroxymyristoyl] glucosamine N-acyltransferase
MVQGNVVGDESLIIEGARSISEAGPGHITFLDGDRHLKEVEKCQASAIVTRPGQVNGQATKIEVADPLLAFLQIYQHFHGRPEPPPHGIDPAAHVHPSVSIGSDPSIYPAAYVGEGTVIGHRCKIHPGAVVGPFCKLGDDVTLHPHAVLYDGCKLGNRVTVHANAVIGKDGFGFRQQGGKHVRVPQLGTVEIGDDVEIGAGTTIDRGTFQATRIGSGTKIDNQVQIAHNCRIGRHNLIISQVGIAGSSTTGDYVVLAGQAGIVDHVHLGDGVVIGAQSGVIADVPAGQRYLGTPARPERDAKLFALSAERVPELRQDVRAIKKKLGLE